MMLSEIYGWHKGSVPNELKEIHKWFTGERKLPNENQTLTEQAAAVYLSAKLPRGLFYEYDPICQDAKALLEQALTAGEEDALRLALYVDMGLCAVAEYDFEAVPSRLEALYEKTGDQELKDILSDFPAYLTKLKADRENIEMVVIVLGLKEQGLPPDLGAHDPAYYGDD